MNIILSLDKQYLLPAKVLVKSLTANHNCELNIYLLHSEIEPEKQKDFQAFASACASQQLTVQFITVDDRLFRNVPLAFGLPRTTYYRFLAAKLLPRNISRALYLDCDIIVNRSIEEFYHMDLEGNLFAACEDIGISVLHKYEFLSIYGQMGRGLCNGKYFNAGVLLFNLERARRDIRLNDVADMIKAYRKYITFSDQDILNFMYGPYTVYADYRLYNMGAGYVTKENEAMVMDKTAIIHYYGGRMNKPWMDKEREKSRSCTTRLWWQYARDVADQTASEGRSAR